MRRKKFPVEVNEIITPFLETSWGSQTIQEIELLSMSETDPNGYYKCYAKLHLENKRVTVLTNILPTHLKRKKISSYVDSVKNQIGYYSVLNGVSN